MACKLCTPSARLRPENPFHDASPMASSPTAGLLRASCGKCEQPALHLWQDVYEDTLHFWSSIDTADEARIAASGTDGGDSTFVVARAILRGKTVLLEHPVTGVFAWCDGAAVFGLA